MKLTFTNLIRWFQFRQLGLRLGIASTMEMQIRKDIVGIGFQDVGLLKEKTRSFFGFRLSRTGSDRRQVSLMSSATEIS